MSKRRGYVTGRRVTFRFYERFTDAGSPTRQTIQARLGKPGGRMRSDVQKHDPACIIVFEAGEPIAWSAFFRAGQLRRRAKQKLPAIQVYVRPEHRRRGIGQNLLKRMADKKNLWDGPLIEHWLDSQAAKRCFARAGFE